MEGARAPATDQRGRGRGGWVLHCTSCSAAAAGRGRAARGRVAGFACKGGGAPPAPVRPHLPLRSTPLALTSGSLGSTPSSRAGWVAGLDGGVRVRGPRGREDVGACTLRSSKQQAQQAPAPRGGGGGAHRASRSPPQPTRDALRDVRKRGGAKHEHAKPRRLPRDVVLVAWRRRRRGRAVRGSARAAPAPRAGRCAAAVAF